MKRIIITKIKMKNFRGASNYECDFNVAKTCIAGKNGSGKSRHFDAFLWCLTGKDTKDRKDFEIWNKGLTKETDHRVASEKVANANKLKGFKHYQAYLEDNSLA